MFFKLLIAHYLKLPILMLDKQQIYFFGRIQTCETGGHLYIIFCWFVAVPSVELFQLQNVDF